MWINNAIAKFIIEKGYGYPTESIEVSTAAMEVSLPKGELHIDIELWKDNIIDWFNEEVAKGNIEEIGIIYEDAPQFFMIPQWVHEEYNINTIDDMKEHWELFQDPEDPTKGYFINCMTGWQCSDVNDIKMEAYGLKEYYTVITPGTSGAEDAAIAGPAKKHEPIFAYYWAPTALMGMFDWYILEEPEYNDDVWNQILAAVDDPSLRPLERACAYKYQDITKGIWTGLRNLAPDVVEMLEKMVVGLDPLNKTAAWTKENEVQDYEKSAVWFLREYESRWKTWVTTDAYNKVKQALDDYGPIP
jgi:glycine betaine/proline transport system substrate-binding protein